MFTLGNNEQGRLGINASVNSHRSSPTQVPGTSWSHVRHGVAANYGFRTDGTLWVWGDNGVGNLGLNAPEVSDRSSPTQIPGTNWSDLVSCASNALAIKTDGTIWSWGYQGAKGSLGQNNQTNYSSPTQIPGTWLSISASGQHTYHALKA